MRSVMAEKYPPGDAHLAACAGPRVLHGPPGGAARRRVATSYGQGACQVMPDGIKVASETVVMSPPLWEKTLAAPQALGLESRTLFRREAAALQDALPEGSGRLVIDLTATQAVDSAGLGALMLIQRRAAEKRQTVCLRGANEELRFLLVLTKLDDLFELETGVS